MYRPFAGGVVLLLPRPEGTKFKISGDAAHALSGVVAAHFQVTGDPAKKDGGYMLTARNPGAPEATGAYLKAQAAGLAGKITVDYVDGLSPHRQTISGRLGGADFSVRSGAHTAGDHGHLHRGFPGGHGNR